MKTISASIKCKKKWVTPTIQVLANGYINGGGVKMNFREGAAVGGIYNLNTPGGLGPIGDFPKAYWDSFHS